MNTDENARRVLERIRKLAENHKGGLTVIRKEAGFAGTGYIHLPNRTEIVFDFLFIGSGFSLEFPGVEKTFSRLTALIDYANESEIDSILRFIETRMKVLTGD